MPKHIYDNNKRMPACTICNTKEYIIVASGSPAGFWTGINCEAGKHIYMCDLCFEKLESGGFLHPCFLPCKRK